VAQPTLVELVRSHLTEQSEPHSAAEVATALDKAHPERGIKTTVVRTTLEGLVAKNQAQRTKQGSSVFYTAPSAAEQTVTRANDEEHSE
jgi:predicted transcriptional regulator